MSLFAEHELPLPAPQEAGASLALARKYRPRSFTQLVGQEHVVRALTQALDTRRLHHAYLFTGTRGVGKTTIARILAKALNCVGVDGQGGVTASPCGQCRACTEIDSGRFVDYIEMDAASNRSVDEMTQVLEQAVYKPSAGRFKVYMIDEVHMLTSHAFNAMLKTLEEPPDYVKFVLATTDPQKVPVTVLSRCLQFNLKQMPRAQIAAHLQRILDAEGVPSEPAALQLLARAAGGSMRDALSLTDQAIAFSGAQVQGDAVRDMLGAVDQSYLLSLLQSIGQRNGPALLATVDAMVERSVALGPALDDLAALLQQLAVLQAVPQTLDAADPQAAQLQSLAAAWSAEDVQLCYSIALKGRQELPYAPDEQVGFTMTLLRMLSFRLDDASAEPPARAAPPTAARTPQPTSAVSATQAAPAVAHAPAAAATPAPATAADAPSAKDAREHRPAVPEQPRLAFDGDWIDFCSRLVLSGLPRELALQSELISHDGGAFRLRVPKPTLLAAGAADKLQAAIADALGHAVRLATEIGEVSNSAALEAARQRAERQKAAEDTVAADPLVQSLLSNFGGHVVAGSVKPLD
ncbi:MAG: DNA polymerase III subunit gamma/tau [Betaproteobacteria bacterium]|nr:DNA polymerase III subunit gamma/tau [Betaproteobacteria bacterium]